MPPKASLNVSLTPELMAYVSGLVDSGQYRSASEVLRAGLRLLWREGTALTASPGQELPERHLRSKSRQLAGRRDHDWG